jgi:hypothetical protein
VDVIDNIETASVATESPGFSARAIQHVVLAGAQPFPRPLPLLESGPELVWDWLASSHSNPQLPPPRGINCYFVRDLLMVGHDTSFVGGRIAVGNEMIPAYRARLVTGNHRHLVAEKLQLRCKVIEEPCFPLAADGNVYGHFLIETLPRLHSVRRFLHSALPRYKVLIVASLPEWVRRIMSDVYGITAQDLIEYDPDRERVLLRQAIWPSLTVFQDRFHPYTDMVVSDLLAGLSVAGGLQIDRVFVSRVLFSNPVMHDRAVANEHELGAIAVREYGFCPIAPETLPWTEQVRLFANAGAVVGRFGSGLHNALFSRRGTRLGILRFGNLVQSGISALRQQRLAYITHGNDEVPYVVPVDLFRRMMDAVALGTDTPRA